MPTNFWCFDRAIAIYSVGNPDHRNLARTLVNAAYVKRLVALQLRKRIDAAARKPNAARRGENDHLVDELAKLKSHIMQASGINDTLRAWSDGIVGNKTFQQVTEEFAEIVIPKARRFVENECLVSSAL